MKTQSFVFQAAGAWQFATFGQYFRLMETGAAVDVVLYRNGQPKIEAAGVQAGYCVEAVEFDRIEIRSAASQAVKIAYSPEGGGTYDRVAGNVDAKIISANNLLNTAPVTVPASGAETVLVAANPARARVCFFNSSNPAKDIWIGSPGLNLVNACIKLAAGELWVEEVAAGAAWVAIAASDANAATVKIQEVTY